MGLISFVLCTLLIKYLIAFPHFLWLLKGKWIYLMSVLLENFQSNILPLIYIFIRFICVYKPSCVLAVKSYITSKYFKT